MSDLENIELIPCELCQELISFDEYTRHTELCGNHIGTLISTIPILRRQEEGQASRNSNVNVNSGGVPELLNQPDTLNAAAMIINMLNNVPYTVTTFGDEFNEALLSSDDDEYSEDEDDDNYDSENNNEDDININVTGFNETELSSQMSQLMNHIARINRYGNVLTQQNNPLFNGSSEYETLTRIEETIGDVKIGVDDLKKYSKLIKNNDNIECIFCTETKDKILQLNCGHKFCKECSEEWFSENKKCPVCMTEICKNK